MTGSSRLLTSLVSIKSGAQRDPIPFLPISRPVLPFKRVPDDLLDTRFLHHAAQGGLESGQVLGIQPFVAAASGLWVDL